ncbi:MAG: HAMP domain-containing histidine kinase [Clostridiales bacterium]|nr:HAMP domain-containing histidine kinase [Clostridiales bacterium]
MVTKSKKYNLMRFTKAFVCLISLICVFQSSVYLPKMFFSIQEIMVDAAYEENTNLPEKIYDFKEDFSDPENMFFFSKIFSSKVNQDVEQIVDYCTYYKNDDYVSSGKALEAKLEQIKKDSDKEIEECQNSIEELKNRENEYDSKSDYYADVEYYQNRIKDLENAYEESVEFCKNHFQEEYNQLKTNLFEGSRSIVWVAKDRNSGVIFSNSDKPLSELLASKDFVWKKTMFTNPASNEASFLNVKVYSNSLRYSVYQKNLEKYNYEISIFLRSDFAEKELDEKGKATFDSTDYSRETYYELAHKFLSDVQYLKTSGLAIGILFFTWVLSLIFLAMFSGKGFDGQEIKLMKIDRIWNDFHLVISATLTIFMIIACLSLLKQYCVEYSSYNIISVTYKSGGAVYIAAGIITLGYLFFLEWLTSLSRQAKAKVYVKNTLLYKLYYLVKKPLESIKENHSKAKYIPKHIRNCLIVFILSDFAFALAILGVYFSFESYKLVALMFVAFVAFNVLALIYALRFLSSVNAIFDIIENCKKGNFDSTVNFELMPSSLKGLAQNILDLQEGMKIAVNDAVKGERTKTELITNVSHDLKTPLTSIINYVDLLKLCKLDDEKANSYIDVLSEKSQRMKTLVEDLVEVSKASSDNIQLNLATVDFYELAIQALGESEDDLNENNLIVKINSCEEHPFIIADGQKTWRIISNLLSNVKKYALKGSRVYIDISQNDDYGIFSIKNISASELNMAPEELTQRFVRGEVSRTTAGNGLGLSIAENLCRAQKGEFNIEIDGDLFKATIKLPLDKEFLKRQELAEDNLQEETEE